MFKITAEEKALVLARRKAKSGGDVTSLAKNIKKLQAKMKKARTTHKTKMDAMRQELKAFKDLMVKTKAKKRK